MTTYTIIDANSGTTRARGATAAEAADEALVRTINGCGIERAEVFEEGDFWRWRIVDERGAEYVDGGNFRTRRAAAKSLDAALDPA